MHERTTLIIIDDHPLFREGFKSVIKTAPRFKIIGEANDGPTGLKLSTELNPDITITNISMPGMSGIELTKKLKAVRPEAKVVILSMHTGIDHISLAVRAGASGYLAKNSTIKVIIEGITAIADNQTFVDINTSQSIPRDAMGIKVLEHYETQNSYENLTPREQQVLRELVRESPYQKIAEKYSIKTKTVENHRSNIMKKLGLKKEIELIRFGARIGLITEKF